MAGHSTSNEMSQGFPLKRRDEVHESESSARCSVAPRRSGREQRSALGGSAPTQRVPPWLGALPAWSRDKPAALGAGSARAASGPGL